MVKSVWIYRRPIDKSLQKGIMPPGGFISAPSGIPFSHCTPKG